MIMEYGVKSSEMICSSKFFAAGFIFLVISQILRLAVFQANTLAPQTITTAKESNGNSAHNDVDAIVVLSVGAYVQSTIVDEFLSSINGTVNLPIYVLTTLPACIDKSKYSSGQLNVVSVELGSQNIGRTDSHMANSFSVNDIMLMKNLKTQLFAYLPKSVETVLYIDRDIRFSPSMKHWRFGSLKQKHQESGCNMMIAADERPVGDKLMLGVNSGALIMHRSISANCLQHWSHVITSNQYRYDQLALMNVTQCSICTMPANTMHFVKSASHFLRIAPVSSPLTHYTSTTHKTGMEHKWGCEAAMKKYGTLGWFTDRNCLLPFVDAIYTPSLLKFEQKACSNVDK